MAVEYKIDDIDPQVMVIQIVRDLRNWADRNEGKIDEEGTDLIESLEDVAMRL